MYEADWRRVDGPVTVYNSWMERKTYASLVEAVHANNPLYVSPWHARSRVRYYADAAGNTIPEWKIAEVLTHNPRRYVNRWNPDRPYTFRSGPVPDIRCRRGGRHYYRRIATTAELRENDFLWYDEDAIEHRIQPRPSRRRGALPTFWDDGRFARHGDGWKNYRGTQHRG